MTVDEILAMDVANIMKLDLKELKQITQTLGSAANKRYKRAKSTGTNSPAFRAFEQGGGRVTTKGKNINEVRAELFRAKRLFESKTGSIKGAEKYKKEIEATLGVSLTKKQEKRMWRVYDRIKELHPEMLYRNGRYDTEAAKQIQSQIAQEINSNKALGVDRMTARIDRLLEDEYQRNEDYYNNAEFYELDEDLPF